MDRLKPFLLTAISLVLFASFCTPVSSQIITTQPPSNTVTILNGPRAVPPTAGQPTAISPNIIPGKDPVSPNIIPPGNPQLVRRPASSPPTLQFLPVTAKASRGHFQAGSLELKSGHRSVNFCS